MNFGRLLIILLVLFAALGTFAFAESLNVVSAENETEITPTSELPLNIVMGNFNAVVCVTIKNKANHVEYFKISQQYSQITPNIQWNVVWTDPEAVKMASNANPTVFGNNSTTNSTGDLGWKVEAGETKTVKFKLQAVGEAGSDFGGILPNQTTPNNFWPLLSEPGLAASWFMPNEIETLNPNLKVVSWDGTFDFDIMDANPTGPQAEGIVRAPIVPFNSVLTFSDPKADFIDKTVPGADTAAWDVTVFPDGSLQHFTYSYHFPKSTSGSGTGNGSSVSITPNNAATNSTVPTKNTGVPYALLIVGVVAAGAGITYAKFLR